MNYSSLYWTFNHFPKFGHTLTGTTPCTFPKTSDVAFINVSFFGFSLRTRFTSRPCYWFIRTPYNRVWSCLAHVFVNVVYVLLFNIGPAAAAPVVLYVHNSANQPPGEISLSPLIQPRIRIKFLDSQNTSLFRPSIYIRWSADHIKVAYLVV